MFAFVTGPLFAFIGPLVTVMFQWLARLFAKSGFYRIFGMIAMIDTLFVTLNKVLSFFIKYLQSQMGSYTLPPDVCYVLHEVGIFPIVSFYISTLISFTTARYFIKLSTRLMS